jgi:diguanylate cyclase (GGDEF)-like protein
MLKIAPLIQVTEEINLLIEEINQLKKTEDALNLLASRCMTLFHAEMVEIWQKNERITRLIAKQGGDIGEKLNEIIPHVPDREKILQSGPRLENLRSKNQSVFFPDQINALLKLGINDIFTIPLIHLGELIGIFALFFKEAVDPAFAERINFLTPFLSSLLQEIRMREVMTEREKDLGLLIWGTEILIQSESEMQLLSEAGEMAMVLNLEAGFFLMREDEWHVRAPFGRFLENESGCQWIVEQLTGNSISEYKENKKFKLHEFKINEEGINFPWKKILVLPLETHNGIIGEFWLLDTGDYLKDRQEIFAALARNLGAALQSIRERDKLERLATTDALTEILNRKGLEIQIGGVISECKRKSSSFLLLILDLDGFKNLNDTKGHPEGDRALRILAQNLKESIREYDVLARTGGDEFTLILKDMSKNPTSIAVIERMRDKMGLENFGLGASIGLAEYPIEGQSYEELYMLADRRLYHSKHTIKGQIIFEGHN